MIARMLRAMVVLALLLVTPLALAQPASAHASQTGSDPAADAVLESGPAEVTVTFDSALMDVGAALVVTAADGTVVSDTTPFVSGDAITVAVPADSPPGVYTVAYRVVSQDGHTVTAAYTYTVQGTASPSPAAPTEAASSADPPSPAGSSTATSTPAPASPAPAPEEAVGSSASSGVVLGVLAILLVLIVGFAVLLVLRSRPRP